ncbi:MAG TPA: CoA-binding protein [Paludibacteraceae bacterium]|jgi:predicted CoA-binding protein|nr:CoA-binding protein [Paludibacteraceae bacterium]MDS1032647.1 CoA-binding protein [Porphyromonadaceae sp. NP-X]NLJ21475.1 CoA-binding protein [Bacteroidales bacterium]MBP9017378.1 CoA-binding protein [Paludibacteraceae bacterium]HNZ61768.1 CoA-binding protein [Paludibacteraceae bacterium]
MKKTLVIGASTNPERYAYKAAQRLLENGHEIELLGLRPGEIFGKAIDTERKQYTDIDTVTLYVGPKNQPEYYDYIISLHPKRVVFNPGTENPEFEAMLESNGIQAQEACTLVLLGTNQY